LTSPISTSTFISCWQRLVTLYIQCGRTPTGIQLRHI
jgi:hypothetical protein